MNREGITAEDIFCKYQKLALHAGRERLSQQTGFLHHHYHIEGVAQAIPLLENFLFAYVLFKNRSVESIQEGKELLQKLLHFQCFDSKGNFPLYLHEYPSCSDPLLSTQLLPIFFWILEQFGTVLGADLYKKMERAVRAAVEHALKVADESFFSYRYRLKLASSLMALGKLLKEEAFYRSGLQPLEKCALKNPHADWFSPGRIGDILIALQMNPELFSESPWKDFWKQLFTTYEPSIAAYIGPCVQNYYWKASPQPTLYDFFMASFKRLKTLPERLTRDSILQLHAALIQPQDVSFSEKESSVHLAGSFEDTKWSLCRSQPPFFISTLDHTGNKEDCLWKGILPMQLLAGESENFISLVAQGGNYRQLTTRIEMPDILLDYELSTAVDVEHKEEKRELVLSLTRDKEVSLMVNRKRSNTFKCGDAITIHYQKRSIRLMFSLLEGEGRFIGHIMPGNRASQLALKNGNRFNAYDWQFFLRTLSRTSHCRIRLTITIEEAP